MSCWLWFDELAVKVEGGVHDLNSRLPPMSQDLRQQQDRAVWGPSVQCRPGAGHWCEVKTTPNGVIKNIYSDIWGMLRGEATSLCVSRARDWAGHTWGGQRVSGSGGNSSWTASRPRKRNLRETCHHVTCLDIRGRRKHIIIKILYLHVQQNKPLQGMALTPPLKKCFFRSTLKLHLYILSSLSHHYARRRFEIKPKYCSMTCIKLVEEAWFYFSHLSYKLSVKLSL